MPVGDKEKKARPMWSHGQRRRMDTTKTRMHPTGIKKIKLSRFDSKNQAHGVPLFWFFFTLAFPSSSLLTSAAQETPTRTRIDRDTEKEIHREQDIEIQE